MADLPGCRSAPGDDFSALTLGAALALNIPAVGSFFHMARPRPGNPDSQILFTIAIPVFFLALLFDLFRVFWLVPDPKS